MLKIRRLLGRLIFNMGIAIPGKTVFLIETAPSFLFVLFVKYIQCRVKRPISQIPECISHNAPFRIEICTFLCCFQWKIVEYGTGVIWDLWIRYVTFSVRFVVIVSQAIIVIKLRSCFPKYMYHPFHKRIVISPASHRRILILPSDDEIKLPPSLVTFCKIQ